MAIEWLQDRDSALKDQFVVDGEVFGSVRGPVGSGKGYYEWQFKNWVPTKGYVSGRSRTRTAAKNKLKAAYRLWAKGRQQNPSLTLHIPPRLAGKIKIRTNGKGIRVRRTRVKNPPTSKQKSYLLYLLQKTGYGTGWMNSSFKDLGATMRERSGRVEDWVDKMNTARASQLISKLSKM